MKNIEDKFEDIDRKFRNFIEDKFFNLIYNYGDGISMNFFLYDIRFIIDTNIEINTIPSIIIKKEIKERILNNIRDEK